MDPDNNQAGQPEEPNPLSRVPVVAIGASAGGLPALERFFDALPERVGAAFIVAVHLNPEAESGLARILASHTELAVAEVVGTSKLEANHVYVISPDRRLQIGRDTISAVDFEEPRGHRAPIDLLFSSLAEEHGDGLAVILTGAGSDGAIGVKAIKEAGGIVLAQDPEEAQFDSMPRSAISTGVVDFVFPLADLAQCVAELVQKKSEPESVPQEADAQETVRRILAHLRVRTGHDFTNYKRSTVLRRIARRIHVTKQSNVADYYSYLAANAEEAHLLLRDLLISVTQFFRDPEAFNALASEVIGQLFRNSEPRASIRVWVPGCATGEEAYSIGMLLLEEAGQHEDGPSIQIFASDLDTDALARGRNGSYPLSIEAEVRQDRLRRCFTRDGDNYHVRKELRDIVLFASHNVLKDPPFSHVDLVSCRNLLIYLDRDLQDRTCASFHYALNPGGFLFLGASESADTPTGLFRAVDRKYRIFESTAHGEDRPRFPLPPISDTITTSPVRTSPRPIWQLPKSNIAVLHKQVLENNAPPSILVDEAHRIVHLSENAGRYLQPAGGLLTGDAVDLVRPELRAELRSALHKAFDRREPTLTMAMPVQFNGSPHRVYLQVKPASSREREPRHALVLFIEGEAVKEELAQQAYPEQRASDGTDLREELEATRSRLRSLREEFEGANEELRAANEELQSSNEEYRSTSEELETSKEELQSMNEELQTVNNELKFNLDAASRAHSDLHNLMVATDVATVFLDRSLRIKRFTPRLNEIFNIIVGDEGRRVTDLTHRLRYESLADDAIEVFERLAPLEREVESHAGRWYLMRIRPYRTAQDTIDGVVMTFVDITERRQTEKEWERRQKMLLAELTHRVKNTLAIVQSIVHQTFRKGGAKKDILSNLDGRLAALAATHTILVDADWSGADLAMLARHQLEGFVPGDEGRVTIEGSPVRLPTELATPVGLVLHELATNAVKHGALSVENGRVHLSWRVNEQSDPTLHLRWRETGGPAIIPNAEGFGTALIERAIPNAKVRREFMDDGLICTIEVILSEAR